MQFHSIIVCINLDRFIIFNVYFSIEFIMEKSMNRYLRSKILDLLGQFLAFKIKYVFIDFAVYQIQKYQELKPGFWNKIAIRICAFVLENCCTKYNYYFKISLKEAY